MMLVEADAVEAEPVGLFPRGEMLGIGPDRNVRIEMLPRQRIGQLGSHFQMVELLAIGEEIEKKHLHRAPPLRIAAAARSMGEVPLDPQACARACARAAGSGRSGAGSEASASAACRAAPFAGQAPAAAVVPTVAIPAQQARPAASGNVDLSLAPLRLGAGGLQPGAVLPALARLKATAGTMSGETTLGWGAAGMQGTGRIGFDGASFADADSGVSIDGLSGFVAFDRAVAFWT